MANDVPSPLWKKLNLKDHGPVVIMNPPDSFQSEIAVLNNREVFASLRGQRNVPFLLIFVQTRDGVKKAARTVSAAIEDDGVLWFAYPKRSSKRFTSDITRDEGWESLGALGFEAVRQVAIDEDWSALRFRPAEHIKALTRAAKYRLTK